MLAYSPAQGFCPDWDIATLHGEAVLAIREVDSLFRRGGGSARSGAGQHLHAHPHVLPEPNEAHGSPGQNAQLRRSQGTVVREYGAERAQGLQEFQRGSQALSADAEL